MPIVSVVLVALEIGVHVGKGIAEQAGGFVQPFDRVFDHAWRCTNRPSSSAECWSDVAIEIAQLAFDLDVAELVALAFFHHIGDDEVLLVRRQFGDGGNDAEIGIALRQVELPQLLLVKGQRSGS